MLYELKLNTRKRSEFLDITSKINSLIEKTGVNEGYCLLFVPHTTAAITINEGADPAVKKDIQEKLTEIAPESSKYRHLEGNADAHIKSSIIGCSQIIPISKGRLDLGMWQSVFFCEFDGPRNRKVKVKLVKT